MILVSRIFITGCTDGLGRAAAAPCLKPRQDWLAEFWNPAGC
jgi:NAD(P)-dependent dehydrogenase (short-subunit alcohol dehydrogenase family)